MKKIIIIIIVIIVIAGAFVVFGLLTEEPTPAGGPQLSVVTSSQGGLTRISSENRDFLTLIFSLQGIGLDESLFQDPDFVRLQDFASALPVIPVGRSNPFGP